MSFLLTIRLIQLNFDFWILKVYDNKLKTLNIEHNSFNTIVGGARHPLFGFRDEHVESFLVD